MSPPIRLSRAIHILSALWTLALAVLVFCDVTSRGMFSQPIPGTKEIVQNSIVAITFLQLLLAVYSGSMLYTSVFTDTVPASVRRLLCTIAYCLGVALFVGLVLSSYEPYVDAYRIGEYEGESALHIPFWPPCGIILLSSVFGIFAYLSITYYDWTDQLKQENEGRESSHESSELCCPVVPKLHWQYLLVCIRINNVS